MGKGAPSLGLFLGRMVVFYVFTLSVTVATVTGNAYPLSTTKTILPKMFWGECQTEREDNLFSTAVAIPVPYLSNCTLREKAHGLHCVCHGGTRLAKKASFFWI